MPFFIASYFFDFNTYFFDYKEYWEIFKVFVLEQFLQWIYFKQGEWTKEGEVKKDQRPLVESPTPRNKITEKERRDIIETVNSAEYADLALSQIIPKLADEGK